MKKNFIVALWISSLILANPLSFSYAKSELVEWRAYKMALQYIENSISDEAWKGNNPVISTSSKFYTDDSKKISYIEYKISCDSTPDCGFIMMNVDGSDVTVPIASPTWNTPSEILDQWDTVSEKLYYFGPFDLYSENEVSWDVQAFDPQVAVDLRDDTQVKRTKEEKDANKLARETLKSELKTAKLAAKEFKKSEEFQKQKEEIKDQILSVPKGEFSFKALDFAFADLPDTGSYFYTSPGVANTFVSWSSTSDCPSRIPCYNQFQQTYNWYTNCYSWCSPTAVAMLFWYYDRNGKPNLITGTAPSAWVWTTVQALVNNLRSVIGTTCTSNGWAWNSTPSNVQNAKSLAITAGYLNTTSLYIPSAIVSTLWWHVKTEINAWRPIISHMKTSSTWWEWHASVIYGYKTPLSSPEIPIVRMNMGWGNTQFSSNGNTYNFSTIDQNMNSISYGKENNKIVYAVTKFNIN
jgi:Peptidase_C39 like family